MGVFNASRREVREILDPCLSTRWLLVVDAEHPERPARLVRTNAGGSDSRSRSSAGTGTVPADRAAIRAGDRVTVTQETATLRARLQAVALEPAVVGQPMRVRLMGGANGQAFEQGTVVRVRAVAAGEALWLGPVGIEDLNLDRNPQ